MGHVLTFLKKYTAQHLTKNLALRHEFVLIKKHPLCCKEHLFLSLGL